MNEILNYLQSSQNYEEGVKLVKKYCPKETHLIKRFERGETSYNKEKIAFLLQKNTGVVVESLPTEKVLQKIYHNPGHLPDEIAKAVKLRNDALRESDYLFSQLKFLASDEERFKRQTRMQELEVIADANSEIVKYWDKTGEILAKVEPETTEEKSFTLPEDKFKQQKMLLNYRSYVSKAKNHEKFPEEVARRKAIITELEILLAE